MKQIPWTFKTWIERFKNVDLPIGDLANDILQDAEFPEEDEFNIILEHISNNAKHTDVIETFIYVWNFYVASR